MDYMELLRQYDDPARTYESANFDYEAAHARFATFAADLSSALGIALKTETGILIQDATFHSQILLPGRQGRQPSLRFSCFGDMVTIVESQDVPNTWLVNIDELLERHGYVCVPVSVLGEPYTGSNRGVDGFQDWFSRYFGWV